MNGFPPGSLLELLLFLLKDFPGWSHSLPKLQWASGSRCLSFCHLQPWSLSGAPDTYAVDAPWVLHTQPMVKVNFSSFSPNQLLLFYSSLSQWYQHSPRCLPAEGGGFPSPSFPISRQVLSILPPQFLFNLCPYLHPHCHDLSSSQMTGEPTKWPLGLASPLWYPFLSCCRSGPQFRSRHLPEVPG